MELPSVIKSQEEYEELFAKMSDMYVGVNKQIAVLNTEKKDILGKIEQLKVMLDKFNNKDVTPIAQQTAPVEETPKKKRATKEKKPKNVTIEETVAKPKRTRNTKN